MTIVAHAHPFVIGVDTHARSHALSLLATPQGEVIDDGEFPAMSAGMARAIEWVGPVRASRTLRGHHLPDQLVINRGEPGGPLQPFLLRRVHGPAPGLAVDPSPLGDGAQPAPVEPAP